MCCGVTTTELTSKLYHHVIPINHDSMQDNDEQQFLYKAYWRSRNCSLLFEQNGTSNVCHFCSEYESAANISRKGKENKLLKPAHIKAPISKTDPERVKLTLQEQRLKCA